MDSGSWIRKLREERFLKPTELERLSRAIAEATGNSDFYVSHGTLADIEKGGVPSIHKLFSVSCFLRISYDDLLHVFGINLRDAGQFAPPPNPNETALVSLGPWETRPFPFRLRFSPQVARDETTLLGPDPKEWPGFPIWPFSVDAHRYRYAVIGLKDDTMAELLPPGSLVEIDTEQTSLQMFAWSSLRARPLFLVWHADGHTCCWCQQDRGELLLVPHPSSQQPVRRYKVPRDAAIVGRVVAAWISLIETEPNREPQSKLLT